MIWKASNLSQKNVEWLLNHSCRMGTPTESESQKLNSCLKAVGVRSNSPGRLCSLALETQLSGGGRKLSAGAPSVMGIFIFYTSFPVGS